MRLSVTGFVAGVIPSCQLHVSYREKSTLGSYSTDGPAAARSSTRCVKIVTFSPLSRLIAQRAPILAPPADDDPDERRNRGEDRDGATRPDHRHAFRCFKCRTQNRPPGLLRCKGGTSAFAPAGSRGGRARTPLPVSTFGPPGSRGRPAAAPRGPARVSRDIATGRVAESTTARICNVCVRRAWPGGCNKSDRENLVHVYRRKAEEGIECLVSRGCSGRSGTATTACISSGRPSPCSEAGCNPSRKPGWSIG